MKFHIITLETLILLRRDKVMIPALIASFFTAIFANLASDWSVEDFQKILFDIGNFGFSFTGSIMAIFWGTKVLTDSRHEGAVEVQLAAPISRESWLLGKYCGLCACLGLVMIVFIAQWQLFMLLNDFGWMTQSHWFLFGGMYLNWLVLSSLAMLFASVASQSTSLFSCVCLWICGMGAAPVAQSLSPDTPETTRQIVTIIARVWNLQSFNLIDVALNPAPVPLASMATIVLYGVSLCTAFMIGASLIFHHRDLGVS